MIINILYPVCVTMIIVVLAIRSISNFKNGSSTVTLTSSLDNSDGAGSSNAGGADTMVFDSLVNSLIFLAVIILSTTIMVVLYKFKMMKALYAWLMGTSILLLGVFGGFLFLVMLAYLNLGLDYITFVIVVWNFSVGGIVCIFWYAPKIMNQGYLISISVLLALFFSRLPDWTTWGILTVVSIYDIFAVLCPGGPLKILIETAQKRGEEIPAMVYNASVYVESNVDSQSESSQKRKQSIRLGLGDFVFYSVLIGKAASYEIITVFTVFISIITGLFLTLFLLAVFKKALPALPMSIILGIGVFFLTFKILIQYIYFLGSNQIFV
ncbi:hypothetical protein DICPUDRAFT_87693 [Dictyostelium purpureum]|uniref:Presenilin n=1 Tax=Dictyostelium purpureum TaxID=5786 RepID=F0ZJS7_DICPU|nr:uncharacterized protein DICPUDRAFT_87693 [Dictyostelium purpureum]EGC35776.1 hypothetical protein DICPUDRAFT_87693 [Dictyostelium purpureum]|eukprot:XP_003287670.1 hypothetical protein DICPUDRAFT_87693 [Dictyostelium purpureum]